MCDDKNDLPYRDLIEAKTKTSIFLNIDDNDKEKLIKLNSWAVDAFELTIEERLSKKYLKIKQGEVWSVNLGENIGTEMNKVRPCIVLSCNTFNDSSLVTVVPITNSVTNFPTQVNVDDLGLGDFLTGTVKTEQVRTISKARFGKKICEEIEIKKFYLLQEALMKHLGVDKVFIDFFIKDKN